MNIPVAPPAKQCLDVAVQWDKVRGVGAGEFPAVRFSVPYYESLVKTPGGLSIRVETVLYERSKHVATVIDREVSVQPPPPREGLMRLLGKGDPVITRLDVIHEHHTVEALLGYNNSWDQPRLERAKVSADWGSFLSIAAFPGGEDIVPRLDLTREVFDARRYVAMSLDAPWGEPALDMLANLIVRRITGGTTQTATVELDAPPPPEGLHALVQKWLGNPTWSRVLWAPKAFTGTKTVVHQEASASIRGFDNKRPYGHYLDISVGGRRTQAFLKEARLEVCAFHGKAWARGMDPHLAWRDIPQDAIAHFMR